MKRSEAGMAGGFGARTIGIVAGLASSSATRCASALDISPMPAAGIGPRSRPPRFGRGQPPTCYGEKTPAEIAGINRGAGRPSPMYASRGRKLAIHEQLREDLASAIPPFL